AEGNVVLAATLKAGKTHALFNLLKSLADGEPFLGEFETSLTRKVAYFNYELGADMARQWIREIDVKEQDRVAPPLHLRGYNLPFWDQDEMERVAEWLCVYDVEYLMIDPAARAWRPLVDDENDNSKMAAFTEAI